MVQPEAAVGRVRLFRSLRGLHAGAIMPFGGATMLHAGRVMPYGRGRMLIQPGFIALHGNRIEWLFDAVANWIGRNPLDPLEPELILVQNNGMGEWVRMQLAERQGVCAATRFQLPARFQWGVYRQVLGRERIPEQSPLDQEPLGWRLMRLLAQLPDRPGGAFDPLRAFLGHEDDEPVRRHQLALKIADLFDQYQVHRPDWLEAWAEGAPVLIDARGQRQAMPAEHRWQALLWQRLLDEISAEGRLHTRSALHRRVIERLAALAAPERSPTAGSNADPSALPSALPRRVLVFGINHLPLATLELLAALSPHSQVVLAIPNPCRFHWADIIDGRELLRARRHRHPLRDDRDLGAVQLEAMHQYAHPLLAAWGRQARDFIRQLEAYDDLEAARARFDLKRLDMFSEELSANASLLRQVQQHICDMRPLSDHDGRALAPQDRSIVFHIAHSPVRELEILHDQLLLLLARAPAREQVALRPRDIVVMVPNIDTFAPAIRAVFGQYDDRDPRFIPFDIADLSVRGSSPLIAAIDWLMNISGDRVRLPDLCVLLSVPAIAARLDLPAESFETLTSWMQGAGIRWGLDRAHREDLSLAACGDRYSVAFGLNRMLMGYAVGSVADPFDSSAPFAGIDAYGEVGGLDAGAVGALADLVDVLRRWREDSRAAADPATWALRLRNLMAALFKPVDEADRQTMAALEDALLHWLDQCEIAGFVGEVPLRVAGRVWLDALERPSLGRRFRAGGVTFCTLTPMRAIPFEVVCLLGMNERDFPRRGAASDFDLIAHPGQRRPGDRARRDDDRQLMLEALLSARRVFYLSWCGKSARDNSTQPPSVLVAQLRDYLTHGWSESVVNERTTEHPLQPFSRRYFEGDSKLITLASEWRTAHVLPADASPSTMPTLNSDSVEPLTIARLAQFLRNPVRAFFRHQLQVVFDEEVQALPDSEAFAIDALDRHELIDELSGTLIAALSQRSPSTLDEVDVAALLSPVIARLDRSGKLPLGGPGVRARAALQSQVEPMILAWCSARARYPFSLERLALRHEFQGLVIEDWLDQRIAAVSDASQGLWLGLTATGLLHGGQGKAKPRVDKLIEAWVRSLLAAASGAQEEGLLIGKDHQVAIRPVSAEEARATLSMLLQCWREGQRAPLPVAPRTALAFIEAMEKADGRGEGGDYGVGGGRGEGGGEGRSAGASMGAEADADADDKASLAYEGDGRFVFGEVEDACLARCFPDYLALREGGRFPDLARRIYGPLSRWAKTQVDLVPLPGDAPAEDSA